MSLLRRLLAAVLGSAPAPAPAGDFFPPDYKTFPFGEGDLLASRQEGGRYGINQVLKIDRVAVRKGDVVSFQGQRFTATGDDFYLVVGCSYGEKQFDSLEQARAAAAAGHWTVRMGHAPNRAPGAAAGQVKVGHRAVRDSDLEGYKIWREAFDKNEAGVF